MLTPDQLEPSLLNDLHHANTFSMQTDDLLATLMQYFPRLLACIFSGMSGRTMLWGCPSNSSKQRNR